MAMITAADYQYGEETAGARGERPQWLRVVTGVVGLFAVVACFSVFLNVQTFWIPADSMAPTIESGDRLVSWRLGEIERGDLVIFDKPEGTPGATSDLLKRVVALEGDTVSFENSVLHVNGVPLDEPYLSAESAFTSSPAVGSARVVVADGHAYVLGDNRNQSADSRSFGPISIDSITGNNVWVYWQG